MNAGVPTTLSLEDAEHLRLKREIKAASRTYKSKPHQAKGLKKSTGREVKVTADHRKTFNPGSDSSEVSEHPVPGKVDPWAKWRK